MATETAVPPITPTTPTPGEVTSSWLSSIRQELPNPDVHGVSPVNSPPSTGAAPPPPPKPEAAPEPPAEAKTEVAPEKPATTTEEPEPTEERFPKNSQQWKEFLTAEKGRRTKLKTELDKAAARVKELEAAQPGMTATEKAEFERVRKENEQLSKIVQVKAVTDHPKFKQYFEGKTNGLLERAVAIVGQENAEKIKELLMRPDSLERDQAIEELSITMPAVRQNRLGNIVEQLEAVHAERRQAIADAERQYADMQKSESEASTQRKTQFEKAMANTFSKARQERPEYQARENDAAWNKSVDDRMNVAKALLEGKVPAEQAFEAALNAAAYPAILESHQGSLKKIAELEAQVKKLMAATPSPASGERTEQGNEETNFANRLRKDSSPMDVTSAWVKAMRGESGA